MHAPTLICLCVSLQPKGEHTHAPSNICLYVSLLLLYPPPTICNTTLRKRKLALQYLGSYEKSRKTFFPRGHGGGNVARGPALRPGRT